MAILRRAVGATCLVLFLVLVVPDDAVKDYENVRAFREQFAVHSAAAKVHFATQHAAFSEQFAVRYVEARVNFEVLRTQFGEQAAVKFDAFRTEFGVQSAAMNVTMAGLKIKFAEQSAVMQVRLQSAGASISQMLREQTFSREELFKLGSKLRSSGLDAAHELSSHTIQLKAWFQSDEPAKAMNSVKEWLRSDQPAIAMRSFKERSVQEATGMRILFALVMFALVRAVRRVCCHRQRRAPANSAYAAARMAGTHAERGVAAIMKAPTPLRERLHPPTPLHRRRRSDSPAPVAHDGENAEPDSLGEQELLSRLNSDCAEDLRAIIGLGDKSIDKVIKFRSKHGGLDRVQDLSKIIHPATYANFARNYNF